MLFSTPPRPKPRRLKIGFRCQANTPRSGAATDCDVDLPLQRFTGHRPLGRPKPTLQSLHQVRFLAALAHGTGLPIPPLSRSLSVLQGMTSRSSDLLVAAPVPTFSLSARPLPSSREPLPVPTMPTPVDSLHELNHSLRAPGFPPGPIPACPARGPASTERLS